ncbi:MAG TPA: alpha/beta hydrolase [Candidatus Babeliales bacterium]|nr:alpha/beta hydrolase [Candidatus Babeliales bacterium]
MMYRHTSRPGYPERRKEEHALFKDVLLNVFQAEPVSFYTDDAIKISGLMINRPHAKRNILVCHGYRMAKERMHRFALMFPNDNILLFDYRAHGESKGDHSSIGYYEKNDVIAALQFLNNSENTQKLPIIGIGVSMGAVTLLCAAVESNMCDAIILDAPFARLDEQVHRMLTHRYKLPHFPFSIVGRKFLERLRNFSLTEVDSVVSARQLKIPVLMIHSVNDETVPIENAHRIYQEITAPKDLWVVSGSGHARIFTDKPHEYEQRINGFLNSL